MCGLVAVVSKKLNGFTNDQRETFDNLLFVDQLRGKDSTGMFLVTNTGEMELAKEASNATVFREQQAYKNLMQRSFTQGAAMVGHNRAATKGSIIDANAHPFVVDDQITLVHNGTLFGDHKKLADTDVDSHAIAHQIHKHNGDVTAALKTLTGAYALIWHNFSAKTLNFIRNNQRPLHWLECADGWLWASEANMLDWITARFDVKPTGEIAMLQEDTLVTYTQTLRGWDVESTTLDLKVPTKVWSYKADEYEDCFYGDIYPKREEYTPPVKQIGYRKTPIADDIREFESSLAGRLGCHSAASTWQNEIDTLRHGSYVGMECADYHMINPNTPSLGHHLYGTLLTNPNVIIKVHMDPSHTDQELLELTGDCKQCVVQIRNKQWSAYMHEEQKKAIGDGYIICFADSCRPITDVIPKETSCAV